MPRLPVVRGDDAIRAFERMGFLLDHWRGSHAILYHADDRHLSVPGGRKELRPGTLRTIIRKAELSIEQFRQLLD